MSHPDKYRVIGLMSGSSLDGLDIACCEFENIDGQWRFFISHAACADYTDEWVRRLSTAHQADGKTLWKLHADFGNFCGQAVRRFIDENSLKEITLVASHGHTVFHFPQERFTAQIGDGAALAAQAGLPVICDFRSGDIAKAGQGAPLVPVGDRLLFAPYKYLLNLGGIANITIKRNDGVSAFDICSANQVLNFYALQKNMPYDHNGDLAAKGALDKDLFDKLNSLAFYLQPSPKSLDNGYSRDIVIPLMEQSGSSIEDKLHTYCEHMAFQIHRHIAGSIGSAKDKMLASGGGALNRHLINRIAHHVPVQVEIPDEKIIQYKEALIFAFMGLLRWRGEINIFTEVTGAQSDSIAGAVYLP